MAEQYTLKDVARAKAKNDVAVMADMAKRFPYGMILASSVDNLMLNVLPASISLRKLDRCYREYLCGGGEPLTSDDEPAAELPPDNFVDVDFEQERQEKPVAKKKKKIEKKKKNDDVDAELKRSEEEFEQLTMDLPGDADDKKKSDDFDDFDF